MGRLSRPANVVNTENVSSGYTYPISSVVLSGETKNIYVFVDESGNVNQIEKKQKKERLRYYIDPNMPQVEFIPDCLIGINDPVSGDCSLGIGLGIGDNLFARANYS